MVSMVQNQDVQQKDLDHAVVVAVTSRALFESETEEDDGPAYRGGVAFPLLQALQRVNEHLLEKDPTESLLFDVVLMTTDRQQQQQSSGFMSSTRHHGLEVSRFCFSSEEDFVESLLKNNIHVFVTTDENEAFQANQKGVLSLLLDENSASCPSEQLRVLFCENSIIRPGSGPTSSSREAAQTFSSQLGKMRQKLETSHSPLCFTLVTLHGGKDRCCGALKALRSVGVSVDEAYCLAGAPRSPILSLLRPHFLLSDGCSGSED
ncbi:cytosolic 5'-nucleotidase 1A [Austrofundulus limnaeus]|uniref:Cytosolic 5'-nucleotidase 1A n=1 Tax=Austrofundulus limnaeus TaxID=52670 RepID=A0A2I4C9X8_AUSLI|nr:PREDICTED: cytosolic 5'-nucleotidase 1A-like [Austrofundulus limnaeus]